MGTYQLLDRVPVWVFFLGTFLVTVVSLEVGHRLGARRRRNAMHERVGPVGTVVGATIGLLGFMVALTLGAAATRLDARRDAAIDGVNAIESAYRAAGLVPEPHKSDVRAQLREYVRLRIEMPKAFASPADLSKLDAQVRDVQKTLWSHAETLAAADRGSSTYAQFAVFLNDVFRIYNRRIILGSQYRIHPVIWAVLFFVTVASMLSVGFMFGLTGSRSVIADLALAATFATVMVVIFDLDQPTKGLIDVNDQPMTELLNRMKEAG